MSKKKKLLERLLSKPKDFTWAELSSLLTKYVYEKLEGDGSRVKFFHEKPRDLIIIHKPHPSKILKDYQIKEIINHLKKIGVVNGDD